jgi:hypothetical protein
MNFSQWRALSADERQLIKWRHRPHVKAGTIFIIVFLIFVALFIARISKNETRHLNTKPSPDQAYTMAQSFVKDKLKLPASANFPKNKFDSNIDPASDVYQLNGFVNAQDTQGRFIKQQWTATLKFIGGDWSERGSWEIEKIEIK